ncbi:MAG: PAS domain S-box protein [Spirochaetota bacterium]
METYHIRANATDASFLDILTQVSEKLAISLNNNETTALEGIKSHEDGKTIHIIPVHADWKNEVPVLRKKIPGPVIFTTGEEYPGLFETIQNADSTYLLQLPVTTYTLHSLISAIIDAEHHKSRLHECTSHFTEILNNINDIVYGHDLDGNIIHFNAKSCELTGYSAEELSTMNVWEVLTDDSIDTARQMVQDKLTGAPFTTYEVMMRTREGREFPVEVNSKILFKNGKPVEVLGIARDITERKKAEVELRESEERFRTYTESTSVAIMIYQENRWIYANPAAEKITGYSVEELKVINFWDFVHPDHRELVKERGLARLRGENPENEYEFKILTRNGKTRWVETRADIIDYAGQRAVLISAINITDRKKIEESLRMSLEDKVILLREIHHRVKNNFQIITSLLNLQARNTDNPDISSYFNTIYNRIRSMALVHEKLYHSENIASLDFNSYILSLVNELQQSYTYSSNINIQVKGEKIHLTLDQAVSCGLIINELISNALKYAFCKKTGDEEVIVSLSSNGNGFKKISVRDNGIGIPDNVLKKSTDTLGIQLVHLLTEQMNGSLRIDNTNGTECVIEVPLD